LATLEVELGTNCLLETTVNFSGGYLITFTASREEGGGSLHYWRTSKTVVFQRRDMAPQHNSATARAAVRDLSSESASPGSDYFAFLLSSSFMHLIPLIPHLMLEVVQER